MSVAFEFVYVLYASEGCEDSDEWNLIHCSLCGSRGSAAPVATLMLSTLRMARCSPDRPLCSISLVELLVACTTRLLAAALGTDRPRPVAWKDSGDAACLRNIGCRTRCLNLKRRWHFETTPCSSAIALETLKWSQALLIIFAVRTSWDPIRNNRHFSLFAV